MSHGHFNNNYNNGNNQRGGRQGGPREVKQGAPHQGQGNRHGAPHHPNQRGGFNNHNKKRNVRNGNRMGGFTNTERNHFTRLAAGDGDELRISMRQLRKCLDAAFFSQDEQGQKVIDSTYNFILAVLPSSPHDNHDRIMASTTPDGNGQDSTLADTDVSRQIPSHQRSLGARPGAPLTTKQQPISDTRAVAKRDIPLDETYHQPSAKRIPKKGQRQYESDYDDADSDGYESPQQEQTATEEHNSDSQVGAQLLAGFGQLGDHMRSMTALLTEMHKHNVSSYERQQQQFLHMKTNGERLASLLDQGPRRHDEGESPLQEQQPEDAQQPQQPLLPPPAEHGAEHAVEEQPVPVVIPPPQQPQGLERPATPAAPAKSPASSRNDPNRGERDRNEHRRNDHRNDRRRKENNRRTPSPDLLGKLGLPPRSVGNK